MVNQKTITTSSKLMEAVAMCYCLHYILQVHFAAAKSYSIVDYVIGLRKKIALPQAAKNLIYRLNVAKA